MDEYPKVIHLGVGTFTVTSAEEEARLRAPQAVPDPPLTPERAEADVPPAVLDESAEPDAPKSRVSGKGTKKK